MSVCSSILCTPQPFVTAKALPFGHIASLVLFMTAVTLCGAAQQQCSGWHDVVVVFSSDPSGCAAECVYVSPLLPSPASCRFFSTVQVFTSSCVPCCAQARHYVGQLRKTTTWRQLRRLRVVPVPLAAFSRTQHLLQCEQHNGTTTITGEGITAVLHWARSTAPGSPWRYWHGTVGEGRSSSRRWWWWGRGPGGGAVECQWHRHSFQFPNPNPSVTSEATRVPLTSWCWQYRPHFMDRDRVHGRECGAGAGHRRPFRPCCAGTRFENGNAPALLFCFCFFYPFSKTRI